MAQWLALPYWPFEPVVLLGVELTAVLYVLGSVSRFKVIPSSRRRLHVTWRDVAFFAGLVGILVALQSPVDTLARQLFWMHMAQHLLLITVAAPLLVVAAPGPRLWRALPLGLRRPVAAFAVRSHPMAPLRAIFHVLSRPSVAFVLSGANLWLWHLPQLYDVTLHHHLVHHLEHTLFLGLGLLFWAQVIDQKPLRASMSYLQRAAYVFAATVVSWILAGVLAFSGRALYGYADLPWRPGGISALTDQQIGAGIMWVPGAVTYAIVFVACLFLWLDEEDRRQVTSVRPAGPRSA